MKFDPVEDIYDIKRILDLVLNMKISVQQNFYTFIMEELGSPVDLAKVDSNIASIINILVKVDLTAALSAPQIHSFEISRKNLS